jgi:putative copper resistance protein D
MLQTGADAALARRTALWIAAEFLLALLIVALASQLAQTVPGRHDAVAWHLPFRVSVDATWDTRWVPEKVYGGIALLLVAAGLALAVWHGRLTRAAWLSAIALLGAAGLALAVHALLVDAYPETYRRSSVPYQTVSVAVGAELFEQHCAGCHGRTGRGDGELGKALSIRPADLTEPHTALHTAGDLFWWLTHGKPPGVMPGFANRLSEDDRWDLINFLRTLSVGYQARIITERVLPGHPWLPAIDFNFTTTAGRSGTLKDYRERSAVLLVFFTWPDSAERLAALARDAARLQAAGTEVLAVPLRPQGGIDLPALPIVDEGAEDTARSYALLRRTLLDPDSRDEHPVPQHMELLVDRFGYIRARWLPRQGVGWNDIARLLEQIALLQREPQIKPPPDEHVH